MCKRFGREEGQGIVEYILIIALVAMVAFAAIKMLGTNTKQAFQNAAGMVQQAGQSGSQGN